MPKTTIQKLKIPADVAAALAKRPALRSVFEKLPPSHRKEHLDWIEGAKKPETRQRRIEKMLQMLAEPKKKDT